jgi:hypothetical protein
MGAGAGASPAVEGAGREGAAAAGVAGAGVVGGGAGDVEIPPGLGVGLDEELRFLRMELVLSRIECLTTTFCSLNSMTNSFVWTSRPPTNAPTYGMKFSAFAVLRAQR